jgi:hypothetical protein
MFEIAIFIFLITICIPGVLIFIKKIPQIIPIIDQGRQGRATPLSKSFIFVIVEGAKTQVIGSVLLSAVLGALLYNQTSLHNPFMTALINNPSNLWPALLMQIKAALLFGTPATLIFLFLYYGFFRPLLDSQTAQTLDGMRVYVGFWGRLLFGGVVEEVIIRYQLQTVIVWLASFILSSPSAINYIAIFFANAIFTVFNLPGFLYARCTSLMFFATLFLLHGGILFIFGWLFWQYGIIAATTAHMLHHIIWISVEKIKR